MGIHAEVVANGLRIRGFAGLPDGSKWVLDELVTGGDRSTVDRAQAEPDAAGCELARRMKLAGADDVLREAEAMAT